MCKKYQLPEYKDSPHCRMCDIRLDGLYATCYADSQMADICGECVLKYIDPNPDSLLDGVLCYVDKYNEILTI